MGLQEDINEVKEMLRENENKLKEKEFKLPYSKRVRTRLARNNYVTVIKINENGTINFLKLPIRDQTIMVDKIPRLAAAGYVMYWKKNPVIILPSWSVEPFSPLEHYQKSLVGGDNTAGYQLLMARMEMEKVESKVKISGALKWILGLGVAALIGYALITGGGG